MSVRYRRISPSEWGYLAAARVFPPLAVQLWIEAENLPDTTALTAALARAADANRGARLVPRGRWWIDTGEAPRVQEIPASEPITDAHPVFRREFEFSLRPALEVWKVNGQGLLFRSSHALMDARGLLFFAEETFRALRGEALLGSTPPLSDRDYLLRLGHPRRRGFPRRSSASPLPPSPDGAAGFVWARRSLAGEVPALNAKLQGAIARLALRRAPGRAVRFMIPVDLRQNDATLRTTNNLSNALLPQFSQLDHWSEAYARTLQLLARHDERATEPFDALVPWIPLPLLARAQKRVHSGCVKNDRYLFSAVVSHIGRIPLANLSCAGFTPRSARFMSFDAPGSALTLVVSQHDHGAEICASAPAANGDRRALELLLDEVCAGIAGAPTVLALIAGQAARVPHQRAVSDASSALSYAQLEARAQSWAARLRRAGVAPGDRVAICAARSADVVAALLGILRCGAAFVPVDIDWPQQRAGFVLRDCGAACIVADAPNDTFTGIAPLLLTGARDETAGEQGQGSDSAGVAYVMYTSGSTGLPKGVSVGHASLSNYLRWARTAYADGPAPPVFPLFTSLAFDLTLTALFLPLVTGGELRVVTESDPLSAARAILADRALTAIKLTPSHLRLLCELGLGAGGLRTFIVGGEELVTWLAAQAAWQCTGAAIFNEYGPTEATVGCIVHRFDEQRDRERSVPIGAPIANTQILLLDEHGKQVAPGEVGEITIAGECLALGYLSQPDENPRFAVRAGVRTYRSGDLGSVDAAGVYRYHGRADDLVKVLGHRVELAEIEHALATSVLVKEAVAVFDRSSGNGQLVAFVVWRAAPDVDRLRVELAAALPRYMLPAKITGIDALPLSVNGKVDRQRLLGGAPVFAAPAASPPDGKVADEIRGILAEILRVPPSTLSIELPIHEQGCDSLQMAIFLSRVSDRCLSKQAGDNLTGDLAAFLRTPTIRYLAELTKSRRHWRAALAR